MNESREQTIVRLEVQLAFLARMMEAVYRKRKYPMERAHYLILRQLRGGPKSQGELAADLILDHSTITRQIDAMQRLGLVKRLVNPADRRGALVEGTPLGVELCDSMQKARLGRMRAMLEDWPTTDCGMFADRVADFNRLLARSLETPDEESARTWPSKA